MAEPIYVMQPTFDAGEVDPHLWTRTDLKKYTSGLRKSRNFFVHKYGALSNRPGTQFIHAAKYNNTRCVIRPFIFSDQQKYILEFGVGYIRFFVSGGLITSVGTTPYEVVTTYTEDDLRLLDITQSADVLFIACPGKPQQVLTRFAPNNWTLAAYSAKGGPFQPANVDSASTITPSATTGSVTLTASKPIFQAGHVGALWRIDQNVTGKNLSSAFSAIGSTASLGCASTWRIVTHGTWTGTVVVERSYDNGATWTQLRAYSATSDINYNQFGAEDLTCLIRVRVSAITAGTVTVDLSIDPFVNQGIVKVTAFTDTTHITATVINVLGATTATEIWFEGAWSAVRGYPAAGCFWEDRLIWGGTEGSPHGVYMSQPGDYTNMSTSSPTVKDDDAIAINLLSRKLNAIKSFIPLKKTVIALTSDGTFSLSFSGGILTQTSASSDIEENRGSSDTKPLVIGNRAIYIQGVGGTVRDIGYDFYSKTYTGDDLSLFSAHLVEDSNPIELAYQQEPNSIVWMVREDGALLSMTYLKEQQILAWAHHDTQGLYESMCSIPGDGYNEVWFVVNRTVEGQTVRYIERMVKRLPTKDPKDQWHVDCGLQYNGAPSATIAGLDHLEGLTVKIVGDGNVYPDQEVVGGQITISPAASKVTVGLGYVCDIEPLNVEVPGATRGTNQGHKLLIGSLILRLKDSRGGWVGQDENYLSEWQSRHNEPMGEPIQLFTGDYNVTGGFEWEEGGRYFFRQIDPMPVTILAFIPGYTVGGVAG